MQEWNIRDNEIFVLVCQMDEKWRNEAWRQSPANDNTVLKTKQPILTPEAPTSSVFTNKISSIHLSTKMAGLPTLNKPRGANFTDVEMLTIVEEVKRRERVIMGGLDITVTAGQN